jgi:hypothetical protein
MFYPALQKCATWSADRTARANQARASASRAGVAHAVTCRIATHAAQSTGCAPTGPVSAPTDGTGSTAHWRVSKKNDYYLPTYIINIH